jgi:futalosine hydrolase
MTIPPQVGRIDLPRPSVLLPTVPALLPLALICSVPLEAKPLWPLLHDPVQDTAGRRTGLRGTLDGVPVLLLPGGMGKVNAAQALTALVETRTIRGVIGFGVGGAYAGSGLRVGDVALASREVYGDEGVEAPADWLSTEDIGIPLLERAGTRWFNEFTLSVSKVGAARTALETAGFAVRAGPFVTVSCCSGTAVRGAVLAERFEAICESMEGAALAHVCELYELPFLEVRGVSNAVEDRDLARWRLAEAAEAAAGAARVLVRTWED